MERPCEHKLTPLVLDASTCPYSDRCGGYAKSYLFTSGLTNRVSSAVRLGVELEGEPNVGEDAALETHPHVVGGDGREVATLVGEYLREASPIA